MRFGGGTHGMAKSMARKHCTSLSHTLISLGLHITYISTHCLKNSKRKHLFFLLKLIFLCLKPKPYQQHYLSSPVWHEWTEKLVCGKHHPSVSICHICFGQKAEGIRTCRKVYLLPSLSAWRVNMAGRQAGGGSPPVEDETWVLSSTSVRITSPSWHLISNNIALPLACMPFCICAFHGIKHGIKQRVQHARMRHMRAVPLFAMLLCFIFQQHVCMHLLCMRVCMYNNNNNMPLYCARMVFIIMTCYIHFCA